MAKSLKQIETKQNKIEKLKKDIIEKEKQISKLEEEINQLENLAKIDLLKQHNVSLNKLQSYLESISRERND